MRAGYVPLPGIYGAMIMHSVNTSSKVSLMSQICMARKNQPGILYSIVLSNLVMGFLVGRQEFVMDYVTNKLCSKSFLTSSFYKILRGLPRYDMPKLV